MLVLVPAILLGKAIRFRAGVTLTRSGTPRMHVQERQLLCVAAPHDRSVAAAKARRARAERPVVALCGPVGKIRSLGFARDDQ